MSGLNQTPLQPGEVALVGAGPGDPELLTLKALRYLHSADVVVYDRLVSAEILAMIPESAERIFAGKHAGHHCIAQSEIIALLVEQAVLKRRVVRLKGGDPFIFGRGGEEMESLAAQGIRVHVVAGITAAAGCAAAAGIPLTHRDCAHRLTLVTGHPRGEELPDWQGLGHPEQTVVFYMGLHQAAAIQAQLHVQGVPGDMPVALIEQGTLPSQRVVRGTLQALARLAQDLSSPCLIIVGHVAALNT
ncbi:uroporphyrinogen-III C-methyltransferase [Prodigiosinella confusarubida]|nr:uroporphyrinogen-III C-methyltransferase [Serratia sp. ATCC 39006]